VPIMSFQTHLKVVCGHIRQGGLERHRRVLLELLRLLTALAEVAPSEGRAEAVCREVEIGLADARRTIPSPVDLDDALQFGANVLRRLESRVGPREPAPLGAVAQ
jgi:uncharacterized membrane protein